MFATPSPIPFPTFTPHNSTEVQEIQILHQIQQHVFTTHQAYWLFLAFLFPFPLSWKLAIYQFFLSLPFHLNIWEFLFIFFLGPPMIIVLVFLLLKLLWSFLYNSIAARVANKVQKANPLVFLELTFPSNTTKSAFATENNS